MQSPLPETPLQSSLDLGWQGLSVEEYCLPAGEMELPPFSDHALCLNVGQTLRLLQAQDGRVQEGRSPQGELSITPAGMSSRWQWDRDATILLLRFEATFLARTAVEMGWGKTGPIEIASHFGTYDERIWSIAQLLRQELNESHSGVRLYGESLATALAVHTIKHYSDATREVQRPIPGLSRSSLKRVLDYICDNLESDLTLQQLGIVAGVSPNHFAKVFKQAKGVPPHQYIIQCRVERAQQLLRHDRELTVAQIATCVGFADQSHLCRHMRRWLGVTPKQLRVD
jgi:AraC family transcriptional regulator